MYMQFFSETEYSRKIEPLLRKVFTEDNAYGGVFAEAMTEKRIICSNKLDTDFSPPLSDAIIQAAERLGDKGFYWTVMLQQEPRHCYLSFDEFNLPIEQLDRENEEILYSFDIWDYVIYSPSGQWGFMISRDDGKHGLIAGNHEFMRSIELSIPDFNFEQQIHNFLYYWSYYASNSYHATWILPLLTQVCGEEKAEKLLEQYKMQFP